MRGRRPKPAGVRQAQGNPGHRAIAADAAPPSGENHATLPFAKLTDDALLAYNLIGRELKRLNFVRSSDESVLVRYCKSLAQFWTVTGKLDALGSETYECQMTNGGTMQRIHPLFMVQERLAKRLESMEDRLGLSPQARQQYMLRMAGASQGLLPLNDQPLKDDGEPAAPPPPPASSPVGILNRRALN